MSKPISHPLLNIKRMKFAAHKRERERERERERGRERERERETERQRQGERERERERGNLSPKILELPLMLFPHFYYF